jgi:hypothetical protein
LGPTVVAIQAKEAAAETEVPNATCLTEAECCTIQELGRLTGQVFLETLQQPDDEEATCTNNATIASPAVPQIIWPTNIIHHGTYTRTEANPPSDSFDLTDYLVRSLDSIPLEYLQRTQHTAIAGVAFYAIYSLQQRLTNYASPGLSLLMGGYTVAQPIFENYVAKYKNRQDMPLASYVAQSATPLVPWSKFVYAGIDEWAKVADGKLLFTPVANLYLFLEATGGYFGPKNNKK